MGETITIEKAHLATLMRRANLHGPELLQYDVEAPLDTVVVPRQYLDDLKKSQREYNALRSALIRGGVTVESLDLLVQETFDQPDATPGDRSGSMDAGVPLFNGTHSGLPISIMPPSVENKYYIGNGPQGYGNLNSSTWNFNVAATPSTDQGYNGFSGKHYHDKSMGYGEPGLENTSDQKTIRNGHGKRTIYLTKLPDRVTYAQIFSVIRGGTVVDVWMKSSDHAASVSFVDCSAAENFYQYTRKNDIYIDGKRIHVEWREPSRQFVILNNIMSAISRGATRNLLLSKVPPSLTEARIREDLDHIHNLHVEKIEMKGGSILVNLNSVCVALFARTCLMSRSSYKGIRIEFTVDECAERLPAPKKKDIERKTVQEKATLKNRFDILAMAEDSEDENGEEEEEEEEEEVASDDATEKEDSPVSYANGGTNGYRHHGRMKHSSYPSRGGGRAWADSPNGF
ncbi:hypothetical protein BGX38DRAFT_1269561 [Terfezia claveryi]|nr:hypothetical protein BGX38DRAFT_1269561 [Terfezia claveryi]